MAVGTALAWKVACLFDKEGDPSLRRSTSHLTKEGRRVKEETEKKLKEDMSEPPPMMPGSDPRFNGPGTPAEGWERTALREIDKIIQTVKSNKSLGMKPEIALSAIEEIRKITRSALFPTYEKS